MAGSRSQAGTKSPQLRWARPVVPNSSKSRPRPGSSPGTSPGGGEGQASSRPSTFTHAVRLLQHIYVPGVGELHGVCSDSATRGYLMMTMASSEGRPTGGCGSLSLLRKDPLEGVCQGRELGEALRELLPRWREQHSWRLRGRPSPSGRKEKDAEILEQLISVGAQALRAGEVASLCGFPEALRSIPAPGQSRHLIGLGGGRGRPVPPLRP